MNNQITYLSDIESSQIYAGSDSAFADAGSVAAVGLAFLISPMLTEALLAYKLYKYATC